MRALSFHREADAFTPLITRLRPVEKARSQTIAAMQTCRRQRHRTSHESARRPIGSHRSRPPKRRIDCARAGYRIPAVTSRLPGEFAENSHSVPCFPDGIAISVPSGRGAALFVGASRPSGCSSACQLLRLAHCSDWPQHCKIRISSSASARVMPTASTVTRIGREAGRTIATIRPRAASVALTRVPTPRRSTSGVSTSAKACAYRRTATPRFRSLQLTSSTVGFGLARIRYGSMHSSPSFLPWPFRNDSLLAPRRYSIFQFLAVLTSGNVGTGGAVAPQAGMGSTEPDQVIESFHTYFQGEAGTWPWR